MAMVCLFSYEITILGGHNRPHTTPKYPGKKVVLNVKWISYLLHLSLLYVVYTIQSIKILQLDTVNWKQF